MKSIILIAICAGIFLGLIGPFGTFVNLATLPRTAYWVTMTGGGAVIFSLTYYLLQGRETAGNWPWWALTPTVCAVGSLPMIALVWAATRLFYGEGIPVGGPIYGLIFITALPIVTLHHFLFRPGRWKPAGGDRAASVAANIPAPPPESRNLFLERLPGVHASEILCLKVEDHYVRVFTQLRDHLVLTRFSDAVAAMGAIEGVQVHRSWWIARAAVKSVHKHGRKIEIELVNALRVPVSREGKRAYLSTDRS